MKSATSHPPIASTENLSAESLPAAQLKPKEHGAYAILAIPILTSILSTGPSKVGICIAAAAVTGFLAHEPLLVAVGHRGSRAQRNTPLATKRLTTLLAITISCGLVALLLGDLRVRIALVACALVAAFSFLVAFAGRHRTPAGQLLGVVGLSMPCLPMLLAGGVEPSISIEAWITWLLGFTATTIAVRGVIASQKRQSRLFHWLALSILSVAVCLATLGHRYSLPVVIIPMLTMSWFLLWLPPPVKYIKRVGWTLVAGTLATAVWMTIVLSAN